MSDKSFNPEYKNREVEISVATSDDALEIAALRKATWLNTYINKELGITREDIATKDFDSEKAINFLAEHLQESDVNKTWVAKREGKIVGYCAASKQGPGQNEIRAIYAHPQNQGEGVGKQLMTQALEWLKNDSDVCLYVATYNRKSIDFYKSLGFVESNKKTPEGYAVNGKAIPLLAMVRPAQ